METGNLLNTVQKFWLTPQGSVPRRMEWRHRQEVWTDGLPANLLGAGTTAGPGGNGWITDTASQELTIQGDRLPPFLSCEPVWESDRSRALLHPTLWSFCDSQHHRIHGSNEWRTNWVIDGSPENWGWQDFCHSKFKLRRLNIWIYLGRTRYSIGNWQYPKNFLKFTEGRLRKRRLPS